MFLIHSKSASVDFLHSSFNSHLI